MSNIDVGTRAGLLMTDNRKRRLWDDADKIQIIAQTGVAGVTVAQAKAGPPIPSAPI